MTDENGSATGGQPGTAPAAPWYGADEGVKGFVELKGWDTGDKAVQSYKHLESLLGADKAGRGVIWPKDEADAEGWNGIYSKMGRPGKAEEYKLPVPEGDDGTFAKAFAPMLHEAGLSQRQAETLATRWNEAQAAHLAKMNSQIEQDVANDQKTLKAEWGNAFAAKTEVASRAAKALGLSEDDVADVISAMGFAKTQKLFATMGEKLGEDKFAGADGKPANTGMTPAAAQARLEQMMGDSTWLQKWSSGDAQAMAEKQRVDEAILAGKQAAAA